MTLLEQIESDNDFFIDDFAVDVVYKPRVGVSSTIQAIFDKADEFVNVQTGEVTTAPPQAVVKLADVPDIDYDATMWIDDGTLGGTTYRIRKMEHDGYGLMTLMLSEE